MTDKLKFPESLLPPEWHELIRTAKGPRHKNWRLASELEGRIRKEWLERQLYSSEGRE